MRNVLRTTKGRVITAIIVIPLVAVLGVGMWLASVAGELPWQEDPTRVSESLTAFEGLAIGTPRQTRAATPAATPIGSPVASPMATVVAVSPIATPAS